jgi:Pyruvate/2-oxoacid:ferredoxin oxidoreductase delta subunit
VLGALEMLRGSLSGGPDLEPQADAWSDLGLRVLVFARAPGTSLQDDTDGPRLPDGLIPVGLVSLSGELRPEYLDINAAIDHCARGASVWEWASNDEGYEPDVVLGCAGDIPTMESLAAAEWLREHVPDLKVRFVNVVDLMTLFPRDQHPHGMDETTLVDLFTADKPVIFAFHGYQRAMHEIVHGSPNAQRFHVRGFNEQGTTTTPFDMVVLNHMSRYDLCIEALKRVPRVRPQSGRLVAELQLLTDQAGHSWGTFLGVWMVQQRPQWFHAYVALGHGKKAARHIDAYLRDATYDAAPKHEVVTFRMLNPWYYADADQTVQPALDVIRWQGTFEEVFSGLDETNALFEARRCMSCGNCFECDNCFGVCPDNAIVKLGSGLRFEVNYDFCKGCSMCATECATRDVRLQLLAIAHAAGPLFEQDPERRTHLHLVVARTVDRSTDRADLGSGTLLSAQRAKPGCPILHDMRYVGNGLDAVDDGWLAVETLHGGEGWPQSRLAAIAF